jgi:NAD(P)-dependent dehydrogenase (short-subunit alcohol dehydrogenase family)
MRDSAKTIVVTGASSGIGKATARLFAERGWNVVAAMRQPGAEKELAEGDRLKLMPIDVQDPASVRAVVAAAVAVFGAVDVWLSNAGYGAFGPVEAGSRAQIQRQFDVNVLGLIECVQAIAPHFRANRAGVLINVSSAGGLAAAPGYPPLFSADC